MRACGMVFIWAVLGLLGGVGSPLAGQVTWQDLVFTGGISGESYKGNLPAVTVTAVDSTEEASAAVGELGVRGGLVLLTRPGRALTLQLDGGLRQFSAGGFKIRDYAPREWVGRIDLAYLHDVAGVGQLSVTGGASGRGVDDRPPMPLFIQPGYGKAEGRVRFQLLPTGGVYLDAQLNGHLANYTSTGLTPQLDLLDQKTFGVEFGATWERDWTVRLHSGFRAASYENQGTFDPSDPYRRDKALNLGATWTLRSSLLAQVGVEGTFNRSNSSRPEYNALSIRTMLSLPLPQDLSLSFFALLTAKNYRVESEFVQLVPGEEADNASVVYVELNRPLFPNLDGAFRFGWNRAETDIGDSYFERFGGTFLLRYRPLG